ncbi:MAG: hypothetical protein WCC37_22270 [Candidatus Sulfotelmatobacter sp.]
MKVRVSRFMRGGICFVGFESIEVTPDDNSRFQKFGVPAVQILLGNGPRTAFPVPINSLNPSHTAGFANPDEARGYEERVVADVKRLYENIRDKRDEFTSTHEVDL